MGRIKNEELYILDQTVSGNDRIIGSDGDDLKKTKNFSIDDILTYFRNNNPTDYVLPTATGTILGGVKIDGTSITIDGSGVISANSGDYSEWATSTGTRLGGDLYAVLGDYDDSGNGTKITVDDWSSLLNLRANNTALGASYSYLTIQPNVLSLASYLNGEQSYFYANPTTIFMRRYLPTGENTKFAISTPPLGVGNVTINVNTPPGTVSNTIYTMPLSVNGNYADTDGDITVSSVVTPITWTPTGSGLNLTFTESYYIDYGTHLEMQVNGYWTASNPGAGTGAVDLPLGYTVRNRVSGKIVGASVGNAETNVTPGAITAKHDTISSILVGLNMNQTYNGAMTYRFSIVIKIEIV